MTWLRAHRELLGFAAVGLVAFVVQLGLFDLLVAGGRGPLTSNAAAMVVSVAVARAGNRYLAFGHRRSRGVGREAAAFVLVNAAAWVLGELVLAAAYPLALQHDRTALDVLDVLGIGLGTLLRYAAYRTVVFRRSEPVVAPADAVHGEPVLTAD